MGVLILYEDGPTRAAMLGALEREGIEARAADNVFRAIASFTARPAGTVVLGAAALAERDLSAIDVLREMAPSVQVILVFAPGQRELAARGLEAGADAYLLEPFYMEELLALVRRADARRLAPAGSAPAVSRPPSPDGLEVIPTLAAELAHEIANPLQAVRLELDRKGRPRSTELSVQIDRLAGISGLLALVGRLGEEPSVPLDVGTILDDSTGGIVESGRRAIQRTHPVRGWNEVLGTAFAGLARRAAVFGTDVFCSCRNAYGPPGDYVEVVIASHAFDDASDVQHDEIERPLLVTCSRLIATRLGGAFTAKESIEEGARYEWQLPAIG